MKFKILEETVETSSSRVGRERDSACLYKARFEISIGSRKETGEAVLRFTPSGDILEKGREFLEAPYRLKSFYYPHNEGIYKEWITATSEEWRYGVGDVFVCVSPLYLNVVEVITLGRQRGQEFFDLREVCPWPKKEK